LLLQVQFIVGVGARFTSKKSSYSEYVHFGAVHHTNCNPSEQEWLCLATVQIAVILLMGVAVAKMTFPWPSLE